MELGGVGIGELERRVRTWQRKQEEEDEAPDGEAKADRIPRSNWRVILPLFSGQCAAVDWE